VDFLAPKHLLMVLLIVSMIYVAVRGCRDRRNE